MSLQEVYPNIRRSVVAFVPKVFPAWDEKGNPPPFPPIIGTGFVVRSDGVIATNDHVIRTFSKLKNYSQDAKDNWPVFAMLFHQVDEGILEVPLEVIGVVVVSNFKPGGIYYGPPKPDVGFVHVKATGLPAVTIDSITLLKEGIEVATAGFPMGRDALTAPGWLHQITPTLQKGIISAVHPFPCKTPHGFSVNVSVQGGASGSPVFVPDTGSVIGMLFASLGDLEKTKKGDFVRVPTAISHAVPAHYMVNLLHQFDHDERFKLPSDALSLERIISSAKWVPRSSDEQVYVPLIADDKDGLKLALRSKEESQ